jgi:hypothetical protein
MIQQPLDDYFEALERIKKGQSKIIPKGTKISNDAVALEAGRGKGSIKKSRPVFAELIQAIEDAALEQANPQNEQKEKLTRTKGKAEQYRRELEAALAREVSLLRELYNTKKKLAVLTGEKVVPLRGKTGQRKGKEELDA